MKGVDLEAVTAQLGRVPRGAVAVAARLSDGTPAVVETYPAVRGEDGSLEPFPTLYWLTEPGLCAVVGRLESDGWIARIEGGIAEDPELVSRLRADHERYRDRRWSRVSEADRVTLGAAGRAAAVRETGIGGIAFATRGVVGLKCLHLHLAHHLAEVAAGDEGTVVGAMLEGVSEGVRSIAGQIRNDED